MKITTIPNKGILCWIMNVTDPVPAAGSSNTYNVVLAAFSVAAPIIFILVIIMLLMFFVARILR